MLQLREVSGALSDATLNPPSQHERSFSLWLPLILPQERVPNAGQLTRSPKNTFNRVLNLHPDTCGDVAIVCVLSNGNIASDETERGLMRIGGITTAN